MKRILALVLAVVLLTGCMAHPGGVVRFRDMEYTRPDLDELGNSALAAAELSETSGDVDEVLDAVWEFYDVYDAYQTNYNLAYIHCHADPGDEYWSAEYDFCAENAAQPDMYLEELYCALAESPLRDKLEDRYFGEGFFLDYEGEVFYDDTLMDYMSREQTLISEYYTICDGVETEYYSDAYFDECALPLAELLAELVALRQEMAAYLGYDSYTDFAWEYYYYRDFTPDEAQAYLDEIRDRLVPLYRTMNAMEGIWDPDSVPCTEKQTFNYVRDAAQAMGGITAEAFEVLEEGELYDIAPSPDKSGLSFELYLPSYYVPFVFVSGTGYGYDRLSFAHEFGHFATDYAAGWSYAGTDVLEIFSQGMEYLSLCYGGADEALVRMKLADSLCTYVEQAAYAAFEQELYALPASDLTGEKLLALFEEICKEYGFESMEDWDPRDMVTVPHFYETPLYVVSYVVSNDAAMQLYQLELEQPGAGKAVFEDNLDTEAYYFLEFLEEAGLESPFGRVEQVEQLMAEHFGR